MCTCYPHAPSLGSQNRCREDICLCDICVPILSGITPRLFLPSRWPRSWPLQGLHARKSCRWVASAVQGNIPGHGLWVHVGEEKKATAGDIIHNSFLDFLLLLHWTQGCPGHTRVLHGAFHEVILRHRLACNRARKRLATSDATGCCCAWLKLDTNMVLFTGATAPDPRGWLWKTSVPFLGGWHPNSAVSHVVAPVCLVFSRTGEWLSWCCLAPTLCVAASSFNSDCFNAVAAETPPSHGRCTFFPLRSFGAWRPWSPFGWQGRGLSNALALPWATPWLQPGFCGWDLQNQLERSKATAPGWRWVTVCSFAVVATTHLVSTGGMAFELTVGRDTGSTFETSCSC